jgi:phosphonoacetaldehyde hydrolase
MEIRRFLPKEDNVLNAAKVGYSSFTQQGDFRMDVTRRRSYRGPLKLAVFDWAGTTVDYGCMAPAAVFVEGFRRQGVTISPAEARGPMGMEKRAHIETLAAMPRIAEAWLQRHGKPVQASDVDAMYKEFVPLLLAVLDQHAGVIPGVKEAVDALRAMDIKIAASTGYFVEAMEVVANAAARQGYRPAFTISANQVAAGRPAPWMIYRAMEALDVYPPQAVVVVGDTVPDVAAGLNAGVWTVGVAQTGNEVGLSEAEFAALAVADQEAKRRQARATLAAAGAHFVIDGAWELPAVVAEINTLLHQGEQPCGSRSVP